MSKIREELAKLSHSQWSGWMDYLFGKCINYKAGKVQAEEGALIIPKWAVDRWRGQAATIYNDLTAKEKDSDRTEADKFLVHFKQLQARISELEGELEKKTKALEEIRINSYPGYAVKESTLLNRIYRQAEQALESEVKE